MVKLVAVLVGQRRWLPVNPVASQTAFVVGAHHGDQNEVLPQPSCLKWKAVGMEFGAELIQGQDEAAIVRLR